MPVTPGAVVGSRRELRYWTRVMDAAGAMLFGRRTYELMEDAWPQVAREPNVWSGRACVRIRREDRSSIVVSNPLADLGRRESG